ncbi:heparinase II/III family protein [uncultured Clostridium sp.]|uniref:heparinase II/III domain-containing protein n=1 Tax=uncultured Clostridium sp. TaxID=59620 RepID=UPI0025E232B7|nr:heparinase II/III family protein [uncultured Clostridium sp.]MDU4882601.1 heparinase II/III family protein [Clostridium celatum]MDU7077317.1 heparinase II/III family protein [Clostridium celatum]
MVNKYFKKSIEKNKINEKLINEIESYIESILDGDVPQISYSSYLKFFESGIRKDFEEEYFKKRKQLTALALYLQWSNSQKALDYFKELLWSISNEFSWCLGAHLHFDDSGFIGESNKIIDLFSAETAETLSEIIIIHKDKLDKMLIKHIKNQIKERVLNPFINEKWEWEEATHNWSAVCAGCIGITALILENGERQDEIIRRVEKSLEYYLSGFSNDGVSLEGIGYWTYGLGYYIYYKSLKNEDIEDNHIEKILAICNFPQAVQISEEVFVPFSDVPTNMSLPSGLISYLYQKYKINLPIVSQITSFDFDHCYRWAHISRNLWWTSDEIFNNNLKDGINLFNESQWFTLRDKDVFFAIKGGSNNEPHNHNDLGSFVLAVDGDIILTDLGAGPYTAGYFGKERYTYDNTRSYYHSVPLINGFEQSKTNENCNFGLEDCDKDNINLIIDITNAYSKARIESYKRKVKYSYENRELIINDTVNSLYKLTVNEGLISYIKPSVIEEGLILWNIKDNEIRLKFDSNNLELKIEEKMVKNHYGNECIVYRIGLISKISDNIFNENFKLYIK